MSEYVMDASAEVSGWLDDAGRRRVVRCRDCAHASAGAHGLVCWLREGAGGFSTPEDGFCHEGVEGKEGE